MKHSEQHIQHIIFDLTGVIFHTNKFKQFRSIGFIQCLVYIFTHRKNPVSRFLKFLEKLHTLEPQGYPIIYYKNIPLPRCISELMCGNITNQEVNIILDQHIQNLVDQNYFQSKREIKLMQQIINRFVNSKQNIASLKPDKKLITHIQKLKEKGYTLYLLTNFDKEGYANILRKYPEIFALFENIIVSAHIRMLKPYKEIYAYVLNKYQITPHQCLFIDDQKENIDGAQALNIRSIHYSNLGNLMKHLKKYNIPIK